MICVLSLVAMVKYIEMMLCHLLASLAVLVAFPLIVMNYHKKVAEKGLTKSPNAGPVNTSFSID